MVTLCFPCMYVGGLLFGDSGRHACMNEQIESPRLPSGSGYGVSLSVGTLLWNMEGAPLPGTLRERQ